MKKEILKQLKSDYERLEIKPSADLWDRIDQNPEKTPETESKTSFQWWKYAAAVLVLISVGTLIYYNRSGNEFNYKKTHYIVKQALEETTNPVKANPQNQSVISNEEPIPKVVKIVNEEFKTNSQEVLIPKKEKKVSAPQSSEYKEQQIVVNQPENKTIDQVKTENITNPIPPVVAEAQRPKSSYIDADELLQGREFDKNRAKADKDDHKFGVIRFNKVVPTVGNVTVLGVTVYLDSK
ncbi:hypothetical protein N0B40_05215 [Chryseobacterium oranimense]|uniref:hypothetical protein n=1 Tax=Chryseobacterium oranimense TaxID=421058 RepID=UPI0021AF4F90|nr:hypothetical protein [Chryseobacterium oranimense]UWX61680.1 hypothetical protein N0B40_05215 [Chryseobacterium oranimense]